MDRGRAARRRGSPAWPRWERDGTRYDWCRSASSSSTVGSPASSTTSRSAINDSAGSTTSTATGPRPCSSITTRRTGRGCGGSGCTAGRSCTGRRVPSPRRRVPRSSPSTSSTGNARQVAPSIGSRWTRSGRGAPTVVGQRRQGAQTIGDQRRMSTGSACSVTLAPMTSKRSNRPRPAGASSSSVWRNSSRSPSYAGPR